MADNNNIVEVQLFDPVDLTTYTLYLSLDDAQKCQEDEAFAQSLLFHAKVTNARKRSNSFENEPDAEVGGASQLDVTRGSSETQRETEKNSGGNWSVNETYALITAYETYCSEFEHAKKRKHVWQNISNELLSLGIEKSTEKCESKWRNLLRTYKSVKDNKKATERGPTRFLFFDRMDDILGSKPSVSCDHTFNSSLDSGADNSKSDNTGDMAVNGDNIDGEKNCTEMENSENNDPQQTSKRRRKNYLNELRQLKIHYFKRKEEDRATKEKRKQEKMEMQQKIINLEERKLALLEKYLNNGAA